MRVLPRHRHSLGPRPWNLLLVVFGALLVSPVALPALASDFPGVGEVRKLHGGFEFTEGPASDGKGSLYFCDLPTEKLYRVDSRGNLSTFLESSLRTNGLYFHRDGRLFACETGSSKVSGSPSQVVAFDIDTKQRTVIAQFCDGRPFSRVNDLVIDSGGGVYFSDIGGSRQRSATDAPQSSKQPTGESGVYYVTADGEVSQLVSDVLKCNGVLLSPDEKTLYVLPSGDVGTLLAYPILEPGKIGRGRALCRLIQNSEDESRGGDGLTVDIRGNLYLTCPHANCIQIVSPDGVTLGRIDFPEGPANCTFGGANEKTLFVTARTSLYAVEMPIPGARR